jgi:hypothetical protein
MAGELVADGAVVAGAGVDGFVCATALPASRSVAIKLVASLAFSNVVSTMPMKNSMRA